MMITASIGSVPFAIGTSTYSNPTNPLETREDPEKGEEREEKDTFFEGGGDAMEETAKLRAGDRGKGRERGRGGERVLKKIRGRRRGTR